MSIMINKYINYAIQYIQVMSNYQVTESVWIILFKKITFKLN